MFIKHEHFDLMGKVILQHVIFEPPMKGDYTMHDEACFFHIINGTSRLYIPNAQVDINSADSLIMKCGSYLNRWLPNADSRPSEAILVHFHPDVLRMIYEDNLPEMLKVRKNVKKVMVEKVKINEMIEGYVESLLFYFENPSVVTDELVKLKIKELLLLLINTENSEGVIALLGDLFNPSEYQFREVIDAHLFEDVRLNDLAVIAGLSLSSFKRKFRTVFGTSPNRYITEKRLERARHLLEHTRQRISDIAYDCGFNDLGYFSKKFSAVYQLAPTAYRRSQVESS